jgi:hypothetical protein
VVEVSDVEVEWRYATSIPARQISFARPPHFVPPFQPHIMNKVLDLLLWRHSLV